MLALLLPRRLASACWPGTTYAAICARVISGGPQLVTAMPELINPVPRDMPGVEILSGSGAYLLLNEMRNAAMAAGHATYGMMAGENRGWQEVVDNMRRCPTQSQNLLTYLFPFWVFAALAKAFDGNEFGQTPRDCGFDSGRASPPGIF